MMVLLSCSKERGIIQIDIMTGIKAAQLISNNDELAKMSIGNFKVRPYHASSINFTLTNL